ncbi:hypothetical protein DRN94_003465 [archaeon]|mgnify:CR=1 FL=1|nr:hypothetical protein [archaeon]
MGKRDLKKEVKRIEDLAERVYSAILQELEGKAPETPEERAASFIASLSAAARALNLSASELFGILFLLLFSGVSVLSSTLQSDVVQYFLAQLVGERKPELGYIG